MNEERDGNAEEAESAPEPSEEELGAAPIDADPEIEHEIDLGDESPDRWTAITDEHGEPIGDE